MANLSSGLLAAAVLVVLAVFVQSGSALKCYQCNSLDTGNCADEFNPDKLTDVERRHFLQDCLSIPLNIRKFNITTRPVCRKMITKTGDRRVFSRMCYFESENVAPDSCKVDVKVTPILEVEFCESCTDDGCNSGSYLLPLVTLMALPLLAVFRQ